MKLLLPVILSLVAVALLADSAEAQLFKRFRRTNCSQATVQVVAQPAPKVMPQPQGTAKTAPSIRTSSTTQTTTVRVHSRRVLFPRLHTAMTRLFR